MQWSLAALSFPGTEQSKLAKRSGHSKRIRSGLKGAVPALSDLDSWGEAAFLDSNPNGVWKT